MLLHMDSLEMLQPIKVSIYNRNARPPSDKTCVLIWEEIHTFFFVFSFRNHLFRLHLDDLSLIQVGEKVYVCVFLCFFLLRQLKHPGWD